MARRRGNPTWGKVLVGDLPIVPSRFEKLVAQSGLEDRPGEWVKSDRLRQWARANRHYYFVPERLLAEWRLVVRED